MNFETLGVEDVVESTRLNGTEQSMLRPNVTDRNISDIPRSSLLDREGNPDTSGAATEEAQNPEDINAELSMAISDLDISDHEDEMEVPPRAAEQPPVTKENRENDEVFDPVPQTPNQIAAALSEAVGEETLDHDRSNLEANLALGGSAMMLPTVTPVVDHSTSRSVRKSTRSSVRSSQSTTTDGRGSHTSVSSHSSARSQTDTAHSSQGELTCDKCNRKCKNKSGYKSHMKTRKS